MFTETITDYKTILDVTREKLIKAINHLEYSYNKVKSIKIESDNDFDKLNSDQLEELDAFNVRFMRVSDIYLNKYIRSFILNDDPGFSGSFRDLLDRAEKLNLITSAEVWLEIRELRNICAHKYGDDLVRLVNDSKKFTPLLLGIKKNL